MNVSVIMIPFGNGIPLVCVAFIPHLAEGDFSQIKLIMNRRGWGEEASHDKKTNS